MKPEYDFSKSRKNPYASRLKRQVTIRLDEPTIEYFKGLAEESGIGYQSLINLSVRLCREEKRSLTSNGNERARVNNLQGQSHV